MEPAGAGQADAEQECRQRAEREGEADEHGAARAARTMLRITGPPGQGDRAGRRR